MFEKESQDYAMKEVAPRQELYIKGRADIDADYEKVKKIWQEGAEFGYNKANEWHYVKDGEYPTHSYRVLVFTDEGVGFGIYGLDDKKWHTYDTGFDVIAWKEIVLPELKERE